MFIPFDLLLEIYTHLTFNTLSKCSTVNSSFNDVYKYEYFWKLKCVNDITITKIKHLYAKSYKNKYRLYHSINNLNSDYGYRFYDLHNDTFEMFKQKTLYITQIAVFEIPKELCLLHNLTDVYLLECQINAIPDEICLMKNLYRLNLAHNNIKEISKNIGLCSELVSLDLSNNEIEVIPSEIGMLNKLTRLELGHNKIKKIPKEIEQCDNISLIWLQNNHIEEWPEELELINHKVYIRLSDNPIKKMPVNYNYYPKHGGTSIANCYVDMWSVCH